MFRVRPSGEVVAALGDPSVRPMSLRYHRGVARHEIDVHRRDAALLVTGVPECKLLRHAPRGCVVDVEARLFERAYRRAGANRHERRLITPRST